MGKSCQKAHHLYPTTPHYIQGILSHYKIQKATNSSILPVAAEVAIVQVIPDIFMNGQRLYLFTTPMTAIRQDLMKS